MKIFLDANVLTSVLNKEYPLFTYSSRILSLASHPKFEVYTSPLFWQLLFTLLKRNINLNWRSRKSICSVSILKLQEIHQKVFLIHDQINPSTMLKMAWNIMQRKQMVAPASLQRILKIFILQNWKF